MRTLSLDLRERILASYDHHEGTREEMAVHYRELPGIAKRLLQQRRRTSDIAPATTTPGASRGSWARVSATCRGCWAGSPTRP